MNVCKCWTQVVPETNSGSAWPLSHWGKQGQGEGSRVDAQVRNVNTTEWYKMKSVFLCPSRKY